MSEDAKVTAMSWPELLLRVKKWANAGSLMAVIDAIRQQRKPDKTPYMVLVAECTAAELEFTRRYRKVTAVIQENCSSMVLFDGKIGDDICERMIAEFLDAWREGVKSP